MTPSIIFLHILLLAIGVYSNVWPSNYIDDEDIPLNKLNYDSSSNIENIFDDSSEDYNENKNVDANRGISKIINTKYKKNVPLCTVKKILKTHPDDGFEYEPKHYHEYECIPVNRDSTEISLTDLGTCLAKSCSPVHKYKSFMKKIGDNCWELHKIRVNAGCKCIFSF